MTTAILLLVLAVLLAWPVPLWLTTRTKLWSNPFGAMVLWQSIAVSGLLALIGAPLAFALEHFGGTLARAVAGFVSARPFGEAFAALSGWQVVALFASIILAILLITTLVSTVVRLQQEVNQHKKLVRLLGVEAAAKHTYVLPAEQPVAYCLPGLFQPVTVISSGLQDVLSDREFETVLAHEEAHLSQNHHLLLAAFLTWRTAMPFLPVTKRAHKAVSTLVEILADRAVLRKHTRKDLLNAVLTAYPDGATEPQASFVPAQQSLASSDLSPRLRELVLPQRPSSVFNVFLVLAGTLLVLVVIGLIFFCPLEFSSV